MYRRKAVHSIWIIALALSLLSAGSAKAAYFADYFPLTLGSWWEGAILVPDENGILQEAGSGKISVFESVIYDGTNAFKIGGKSDYSIASKSGNLVTIHALFEEGELYSYADFTAGEVIDGTLFQTGYETILLREFDRIPRILWPDIRLAKHGDLIASYLATPGLLFTVDFSSWSEPDALNQIVLYELGSDITSKISTGISSITFWAPGIGQVLEIDIDGETGKIEDLGVLTKYYIAPETTPAVFKGTLTDAITGLGVSGAQLTIMPGSHTLTADPAGRFSTISVPPGVYLVDVSASHYYTKSVPGISLRAGNTHVMNVSLDPKSPLVTGIRVGAFNDGQTPVRLTARVSHPEGAGLLSIVTADLSEIGGSPSQPLRDDGTAGDLLSGDGLFSCLAAIPPNTLARSYILNVKATDQTGFSGFGSILLDVAEKVTGTVAPNQSDTKTFSNGFDGQTILISYTLSGFLQTASKRRIMAGCTVTLTVSGPNGESYGPYEVEETADISIPGASAGTWTYETESNCPSTVTYQIQTQGSGTGILAGRVLDGLTGKGVKSAQVECNTGGATQTLDDGYYTMVVVAGSGATVWTSRAGYQSHFNTGVAIATGDMTSLTIQVVPESAPAQPLPQGQTAQQVLNPSEDPNPPSQPFAASVSGNNIRLKALFPSYEQPVDLYLGITIDYPGLAGRLFLMKSDNTIVELTDVLLPWRQGVTEAQAGEVTLPAFTSGFPLAPYTLYALATPDSSTLDSFELSYLNATLAQTPPTHQDASYVPDPSEEPDPMAQPLAAKVSGDSLLLNAHFPVQETPVTIFLAYLTPGGELYLVKSDNTAEKFSGTLFPWRENVQAEQRGQVLSLPASSVGVGNTTFYSLVTTDPAGFTNFRMIYFQKALQ